MEKFKGGKYFCEALYVHNIAMYDSMANGKSILILVLSNVLKCYILGFISERLYILICSLVEVAPQW